jgi:hypothetical protein
MERTNQNRFLDTAKDEGIIFQWFHPHKTLIFPNCIQVVKDDAFIEHGYMVYQKSTCLSPTRVAANGGNACLATAVPPAASSSRLFLRWKEGKSPGNLNF